MLQRSQKSDANPGEQDSWSTCPPAVLASCFNSQQDYTDNSAAACACTSWHDTFRSSVGQIRIHQNPINEVPSTYLHQFTGLHTVELEIGPDWQQQHSGSWLRAEKGTSPHRSLGVPLWTATMQSIPVSCCWLKLDSFFPYAQNSLGAFRHLSSLQSLQIHSFQWTNVFLEDFANLQQLQSLSLVGRLGHHSSNIRVFGSLQDLPAGITKLQLHNCHSVPAKRRLRRQEKGFRLQCLSHFSELTCLDVSYCRVSFGADSEVVDLKQIKVLVLDEAQAKFSESIIASLITATQLQDLSLRTFQLDKVGHQLPVLPLGRLLLSLTSLQKLDITSCFHFKHLGSYEYTQLRLHSFACHKSQLSIAEAMPSRSLSQTLQHRDGTMIKPSFQLEGYFSNVPQHWIDNLPMIAALTHLTIHSVSPWFLDSSEQALPNLLYLNMAYVVSSGKGISFPVGSKIRELYIGCTSCDTVDLAECTSLTSVGIIHIGPELPGLGLPSSLERLCLHNVLGADTCTLSQLCLLNNLKYFKVGGRASTNGIMQRLPELPPSLHKLDLWDGVVTNLEQLTLLTRLKRLRMPTPPTSQQLSVIKQLRQLRHIEVTTLEGIESASVLLYLPGHVLVCMHTQPCDTPP